MKIEHIYELYKKDVYYFLYHLSQNQNVSEDLTSEVFLSAIKSLPTFRGDSDIKTWLFGIARLKWFEYIRKEKRIRSINEKLAIYVNELDFFDENSVVNKEMAERLVEILELEPDKSKQIVLMRIDGYSFHEIGKKLLISESSARVIDFRTKKKLKEILLKEGYSYE